MFNVLTDKGSPLGMAKAALCPGSSYKIHVSDLITYGSCWQAAVGRSARPHLPALCLSRRKDCNPHSSSSWGSMSHVSLICMPFIL